MLLVLLGGFACANLIMLVRLWRAGRMRRDALKATLATIARLRRDGTDPREG